MADLKCALSVDNCCFHLYMYILVTVILAVIIIGHRICKYNNWCVFSHASHNVL